MKRLVQQQIFAVDRSPEIEEQFWLPIFFYIRHHQSSSLLLVFSRNESWLCTIYCLQCQISTPLGRSDASGIQSELYAILTCSEKLEVSILLMTTLLSTAQTVKMLYACSTQPLDQFQIGTGMESLNKFSKNLSVCLIWVPGNKDITEIWKPTSLHQVRN